MKVQTYLKHTCFNFAGLVKSFCLIIFLLLTSSLSQANDYYWVSGKGNWSDFAHHWATSSGGSTFASAVPTANDNVFFDANSITNPGDTITLNVAGFCNNMDWTGVTNSPKIIGSFLLSVYGSLQLIHGMSMYCPSISFLSDVTGNTLDFTCDSLAPATMTFNGDGDWTLESDLKFSGTTGDISIQKGTLKTNNKNILISDISGYVSMGNGGIQLGSSVITVNYISFTNPFVLDAGTSTINLLSTFFNGNGYTYYNVIINPSTINSNITIDGSSTYNLLSFGSNVSGIKLYSGSTQAINNIQIASSCTNRVSIGVTSTTSAMLLMYSGYVNIDYLDIQDITILGGASFVSNNSTNQGNVVNWTINLPVSKNYYWIGGTGNWSDPDHWSLSSGGTHTTCIPDGLDNVFFDANSFTAIGQSVTVNVNGVCNNMNWTGAKDKPTFKSAGSGELYINGSLTFIGAMALAFTNNITFNSAVMGNTITTAGMSFGGPVYFSGTGGWTLQDNFNVTGWLYFNQGSLNTNNMNLNCLYFYSYVTNIKRSLTLGSSVITCKDMWYIYDTTQFTLNAGTSTIKMTSATGNNFYGGGLKYNNMTASNSNIYISGSNTFNIITLNAGSGLNLMAGSTQTVTNITGSGNCNNWLSIFSSTATQQANIIATSGTITVSYAQIQDISASGGATFNADNSINEGDVSGWNFSSLSGRTLYWIGGTGNWNNIAHWSNTSGGLSVGCMPNQMDSVIFDDNSFPATGSYIVTLNDTANCKVMDWSAMTLPGQSIVSSATRPLNVAGSLIFSADVNIGGITGGINFIGSDTGVINTQAKTLNCNVTFEGNGSWTLQSNLILNSANYDILYMNQGSLTTAGYNITAAYVYSFTNNKRILNLGASTITVQYWYLYDTAQLHINPGTSTINFSSDIFYGGYQNYYKVIGTYNSDIYLYGSNTFNALTLNNTTEIFLEEATTTTFTTLTCPNGTSCSNFFSIVSGTPGVPAFLKKTSGNFTKSYMIISNVEASGGAVFTANNSLGTGNVTGWTINSIAGGKYFWIGRNGNWSLAANWSNTSGGAPASCIPSSVDTVIFDVNSFSAPNQTVTLTADASCKIMTWTGVKFNPTISGPYNLNIDGSLTLVNTMNFNITNTVKFTSNLTGNTITTAGNYISSVEFDGSGVYALSDSLSVKNEFIFNAGTLITNNNTLRIGGSGSTFQSNSGAPRNLVLGSSLIYADDWMISDTNTLTFNSGTSKIFFSLACTDFNGGGLNYNEVTFKPNQYSMAITFDSSNTFNVLTFLPGTMVSFRNGKTQTVNTLNAIGNASGMIYFSSIVAGQTATIKKTGSNFCGNYLTIKDIIATGNTFYAGANSIIEGKSSGWITTNLTANDQYLTDCEDTKGSGSHSGVNLTLLNNTINGGTGNPITWYMDAGLSTPVTNPLSVTVNNGQSLYADVSSGTCSNTAFAYYTVLPLPAANNQSPELCEDTLGSGKVAGVDLNNLNPFINGGDTTTLSWYTDSLLTNPVTNPVSVTVTNAEKFYARVYNGSCVNIAVVKYTVNAWPAANNQITGACEDTLGKGVASNFNLTSLNSAITGGAPDTVKWFKDKAHSMIVAKPDSVTINVTDSFFVQIISAANCMNNAKVIVNVNSLPAPDLGKDSTILTTQSMTLNPGTFTSYLWSDLSTGSTLVVDGSITGQGVFEYSVTVENASSCANSDSVTITVKLPSSIVLNAFGQISLYPIPTNGILYIDIKGELSETLVIEVINLDGQEMLIKTIPINTENQNKLDLSSLSKGLYMLRLSNSTTSETLKIVIE